MLIPEGGGTQVLQGTRPVQGTRQIQQADVNGAGNAQYGTRKISVESAADIPAVKATLKIASAGQTPPQAVGSPVKKTIKIGSGTPTGGEAPVRPTFSIGSSSDASPPVRSTIKIQSGPAGAEQTALVSKL